MLSPPKGWWRDGDTTARTDVRPLSRDHREPGRRMRGAPELGAGLHRVRLPGVRLALSVAGRAGRGPWHRRGEVNARREGIGLISTRGVYETYTAAMADVMIRVPAEVRDQLAAVAEARGTSLRALMHEIAAQTLTPEQIKERAERTRALLAERFGHYVTDEESAEMRRKMREASAAHRAAPAEVEPDR